MIPVKSVGHTILRLEEVPSTNTLVLEDPSLLDNHGLVVIARHQTAGRGRMGRKFASVPGAQLLFSVVLHSAMPAEALAVSSLVSGLAVAEAIAALLALEPVLKWPNDVYVGQRKVCGILVEMKPGNEGQHRIVIGIGINCQGAPRDFPPELQDKLTTLAWETKAPVDSEALLQAVLSRLDTDFRRLEAGGRVPLLDEWRKRAWLQGRRVRFLLDRQRREGTADAITDEGHLVILIDDGTRHVHASGEVEWLD